MNFLRNISDNEKFAKNEKNGTTTLHTTQMDGNNNGNNNNNNSLIVSGGLTKAQRVARKEIIRVWIDEENNSSKLNVGAQNNQNSNQNSNSNNAGSSSSGMNKLSYDDSIVSFDRCNSVAELVCAADHEPIVTRQRSELITSNTRFELKTNTTINRILFPKCLIEEGNTLQTLPIPTDTTVQFNDKTYFQLKIRPEYTTMRYTTHRIPEVPLFFPLGKDKTVRTGAPEERSIRPPADFNVTLDAILSNVSQELSGIISMRSAPSSSVSEASGSGSHSGSGNMNSVDGSHSNSYDNSNNINNQYAAPSWLKGDTHTEEWSSSDLDFFRPRPDLRMYSPAPLIRETDIDWILRPYSYCKEESLVYKEDESIRSR